MDVMLQKHGAKHKYNVPEGLYELCADISREVLRMQPKDIYCFIADYIDALLITRENAKVAAKVVQNILDGSEAIVAILYSTGIPLEKITAVASELQKAFQTYLETVNMQPVSICADTCENNESRISIQNILQKSGTSMEIATHAATLIQAAFRGHYERMVVCESKGKIQWQKAVMKTVKIMKKAGATQSEITKTAAVIQSIYRGYYTRRNSKIQIQQKMEENDFEPRETIQAVAWLDMMFKDSGLTKEEANEAATVIQHAYRQYRTKQIYHDESETIISQSVIIVESIIKEIYVTMFDKILMGENIKQKINFGTNTEF